MIDCLSTATVKRMRVTLHVEVKLGAYNEPLISYSKQQMFVVTGTAYKQRQNEGAYIDVRGCIQKFQD
jgi:hypothetical protein